MIGVKNVTKVYGKKKNTFTALKNVNLTIPDNTSVAILGKSGSGKSTLMHAISGLDKPQQGEVLVDGEDILRLKARATDKFRAQKMAFIFQSFFVEGGAIFPNRPGSRFYIPARKPALRSGCIRAAPFARCRPPA